MRQGDFFAESELKIELTVATATAAATAEFSEQFGERSVFAHAVGKGNEEGPAATREYARIEQVRAARAENKRENENPKAAVAIHTAIHSFSSLLSPQSM